MIFLLNTSTRLESPALLNPNRDRSSRNSRITKTKNLRDTKFSVTRGFPKEIVGKRKLLVPTLKDSKKEGHTATLVYDKLYINGQLYRP